MEQGFGPWIKPLAWLLGVPGAAWLLRAFLGRSLVKLFQLTSTSLDDVLLKVLRPFALPWAWLLGLSLAVQASPLEQPLRGWLLRVDWVLALLTASWAAGALAVEALEDFGKKRGLQVGNLSLTRVFIKIACVLLGALLALSNLGVSIAPLLTALGVGSLAVALALQDTLSNFFSGIHIMLSGSIKVGDYLRMDSGQEGYVADIGWRVTQIRELPGNIILVPNQKLAQAVITNFNQPAQDLAVLVNLGVAYHSDLSRVEGVVVDVARDVMRSVPGAVPDFEPFIRYNLFGDSAVHFTVILRAGQFVDRYLVQHEFIKRLHARFKAEAIEIPFPQRVVTLHAAAAAGGPA